mmetsp:Transcript_12249/g.17006  ORF Transcript_12249/g.17006 Transcript_12249/m.17006 type:complete len:96 (-) Transcript_12249:114-401(-)
MLAHAMDVRCLSPSAGLRGERGRRNSHQCGEIDHFIKIISAVAMFLGVLFFVLGFILGRDALDNATWCSPSGSAVANVPSSSSSSNCCLWDCLPP